MKNTMDNPAICTIDQLATIVRGRFERIQYQPVLINGLLAQTGSSLEAEPHHADFSLNARYAPSAPVDVHVHGFHTREGPSSYELVVYWPARHHLWVRFILVGYPL